jgi:NADPH:quinone reductase-like Zn-dependent oxidoreductase
VELPELGRNGVLIQVKACGLSLSRVESTTLCQILYKGNNFCIGAGHDVAGIVVAVGEDVTTLSKGDHVVGKLEMGTFCFKHFLIPVITRIIFSLQ